MNDTMYENLIFEILNIEAPGKVVLNFSNFNFKFYVVENTDAFGAVINTKDGYIECTNKNGKFLYIYCGKGKIKITNRYSLNTNFYFISDAIFHSLNKKIFSFKFTGGIINKIFPPYALDIDVDKNRYIIQKKNNLIDIEMELLNQTAKVVFYSSYHYGRNTEKGLSISEDDSSLDILGKFSIDDLFSIEFNFSKIFSFMMYRYVENDYSIELMIYDDSIKLYRSVANCYYKSFGNVEICKIDKSFMNAITVYMLESRRFIKLFNIINDNSDKLGISIDFIPEEGKTNIVTKYRAKETVSAIECVLNKYKIHDKNIDTVDFVNVLKEEIDANANANIDNDIKTQLKNSLKNATYPLKQRIKDLYINEENIISDYLKWFQKKSGFDFSDIDNIIIDTIDYRNNNTHNSLNEINENVRNGVIIFTALIYAKILIEIGILEDNISDILIKCLI